MSDQVPMSQHRRPATIPTGRTSLGKPPALRTLSAARDRTWLPAVLLLSPSLLAVGLFVYGFLGWNLRVSFTSWRGLTPTYDFVWLRTYLALWNDERWWIDIRNMLVFTVVFVAGALALGFVMAYLLERGVRGENFLRSVFLLPMAISFIATGIVWRWLLDNGTGADTAGINRLLANVGLGFLRSDWYRSSSVLAIAAVAIPAGWALSGYVMTLFLVGMRAVPQSMREAAWLDGATDAQVFWYITRPTMRAVMLSAVVILVHFSMKTFDLLYAIDQRSLKTDTPAVYMWFTTFDGGFYNRGAAVATVLLVGVALVIGPYIWYATRTERA